MRSGAVTRRQALNESFGQISAKVMPLITAWKEVHYDAHRY